MPTAKYVILGGGMVAGYAAKEMVEHGLKAGELAIVSADTAVPYERPPLSKGFLAGKDSEEAIRISPESFYREHGIELRLSTPVAGLDAGRRTLRLASGQDLAFEKLVIATGAAARTLDLPGALYLRSLEDSRRIRERAAGAKQAAVIGGGFIAMEAASVLAQKSIPTKMVVREGRVWERLFTPAMSRFFESYYAGRGVEILKNRAHAQDDVRGADLVVAGVGAVPVTAALSGIEIDNGVVVNEYLETSASGIYAAGDVANYQDPLLRRRRRVEHWDNAVSQGQHVARALLGDRKPFVHVPYFFSDVFDLSYEYWGDAGGAGETVERGDLSSNSFSVWWLREGRLVAAFAMNRPDEEREAAPRWIESGQPLSAEKLRRAASVSEAA